MLSRQLNDSTLMIYHHLEQDIGALLQFPMAECSLNHDIINKNHVDCNLMFFFSWYILAHTLIMVA